MRFFGVPGGRDALRKRAGGTFLAKAAKQFVIASGGEPKGETE